MLCNDYCALSGLRIAPRRHYIGSIWVTGEYKMCDTNWTWNGGKERERERHELRISFSSPWYALRHNRVTFCFHFPYLRPFFLLYFRVIFLLSFEIRDCVIYGARLCGRIVAVDGKVMRKPPTDNSSTKLDERHWVYKKNAKRKARDPNQKANGESTIGNCICLRLRFSTR